MRSIHGAAALVLAATSVVVHAQECPPGYEKSKKIDWVSCEIDQSDLQCATLEVPRDWTNSASSEKLKLRLVRQPAAPGTKNPQSIITNFGGPGASGINGVVNGADSFQKIVGTGFNIIGFDPRGVGYSALYKCKELQTDDGRNSYFTAEGRKTAFEYNQDQAAECAKAEYQSDLVGTAFTARDINAIVEALGEDGMIRYWGYSYGTLLGATVAAMYPKKIERLVLDGNINPTDYYYGLGDEMSDDFDRGVENFFAQCEAAGDKLCDVAVAGENAKALQKRFDEFLKTKVSVQQSWTVRQALQTALYFKKADAFTSFAQQLKKWYAAPNTVARRSLGKRKLDWDPEYNEEDKQWLAPMVLDAIQCGDVVDRPVGSETNFMKWLDIYTNSGKSKSIYGGDIAIRGLYQCSTWTVKAKGQFTGRFQNIETRHPILFVNTRFDPVTPLVSAVNSAAGFVGAQVLYSTGVGHCTTSNPSAELDKAIGIYMNEGTFPKEKVVYTPKVTNVFKEKVKRSLDGPNAVSDVKLPLVFEKMVKRAEPTNIPAGCTKIAVSSTPIASASSSAIASRSSSAVSISISSSPASASVTASRASSASGAFSTLPSSVTISSVSSSALASVVSSASIVSSASAVSSASVSAPTFASSQASIVTSASVSASTVSSSSPSDSPLSLTSGSIEPSQSHSSLVASVSSGANGPSVPPQVSSGSISSAVALSSMESLGQSTGGLSQVPSPSVKVYGAGRGSTTPSVPTTTPYGQGYPVINASSSRQGYPVSSINQGYGDPPATTSPCFTQAWSSQAGYAPVTQTYTTTTVQTITQCRRNEYCPLNPATPTAVITKTQTNVVVVAVPTTTVYVTKVVDVCSTGLKTSTMTVTETCKSGCTARPTGGWTTTVKYCDACATPTPVTVTYCVSCAGKPPVIPTPQKPVSTPAVPTKPASMPVYGSQPVSRPTGGASSIPGNGPATSSKPAVPVYSKPSVPIGSNSTIAKNTPTIGTPVKVSTLQTNPASTGGYRCSGSNCPTTTKSVVQFTGAASREHGSHVFVLPALFAGLAFL